MEAVLSPFAHFTLLADFIRELYRIEITALQDPQAVQGFCDRHTFQPFQSGPTVTGLAQLITDTPHSAILHITDELRLHKILFFVGDTPVVLGPFCPLLFSQREAAIILKENGMAAALAMEYLSYAASYPFLEEKTALNIVRTLLHDLYPGEDDRPVQNLTTKFVEAEKLYTEEERRNHYILRLERRHACERRFREHIGSGNQRAALEELTRMERDVSYLKRIGSTLENEKIGAAITRTTARLAAMDGGLSSIAAHEISSRNTKEVMAARTVDEIFRAKERMVRAYCSAVRKSKKENRSVFVESVLYAMERGYSTDLSLDAIASELAVSKNHLINCFRKEMGETPMQYLTELRLKHAASLLAEFDLSVQDVATAVGIPDASYFTKRFKRTYGKTPLQYRKEHAL